MKYEFDNWMGKTGCVIVDETGVVVEVGDKRVVLVGADRDQWGVWLTIGGGIDGGLCIASEDGTRSFLSALVQGLTELRGLVEFEMTEASEV